MRPDSLLETVSAQYASGFVKLSTLYIYENLPRTKILCYPWKGPAFSVLEGTGMGEGEWNRTY
jgi:hypothetical protein